MILIPNILFQKIEAEGTISNLFRDSSITLISNQIKILQKEVWANTSHEYKHTVSHQNVAEQFNYYNQSINHKQVGFNECM
jgi:hypothetical protein